MAEVGEKTFKKPTRLEDMSKEQIQQAILKKRECNAKAQNIVESLLERGITEDYLIRCLPDLNQSHFEDIIEERSIIKLCGYPLCSNTLSDKDIPKQKYRISVKTNKVYDITARKSFCCNSCYKAAIYVKKQMLTSPLWFREYEEIPTFTLLPLDSKGSMGQEIDVSLIETHIRDEIKAFTLVNDFAQATISKFSEKEKLPYNQKTDQQYINKTLESPNCLENVTEMGDIVSENPYNNASTSKTLENLSEKSLHLGNRNKRTNSLNIVGDIIEKPENKFDSFVIEKQATNNDKFKEIQTSSQKKQLSLSAITIQVEKHLAEWFTLDTLLFLFGEEKVKLMVADKGQCIKDYLNNYSKSIFYTSNTYDQYQILCRKLNMIELEDKKFDALALQKETKPLPDYSMLKEESNKIQFKVKAFFAGETEVEEPIQNKTLNDKFEDTNLTQIPLVDKNSQNALRRKIVCEQLNKVLPDLLRSLGLLAISISSDIRLLVNTFKLKANNIMFKPIQWTLITIVFIKLLSIRDRQLQFLLEQPTAYQHMQLLLLSYKQDGGYLDRLISWLTDVDRLLDVNDTQLTKELT